MRLRVAAETALVVVRSASVLVLIGTLLAAAGCGGSSSSAPTTSPLERGNVRGVAANDPKVVKAKATAQRRWPEFATSFHARPQLDHEIKYAFATTDGSREHLWVHVTALSGRRVTGTISNDPVGDIGHVYGDRVTVARALVEDWMILNNGVSIAGGFSRAAVVGS
jgi:uncharacterized protein YegJ (DUF2314 family)